MTVYVIRDNHMHWVGDKNGAANSINILNHGSQTLGPPVCIMRPVAILVHYVHTIKIKQCNQVYYLLLFPHVRPANRPTIMGVALCHKKFEGPCSKSSLMYPTVSDIIFLYHCVNLFSSHFKCQDCIVLGKLPGKKRS
jgi:hypothetical protein